MNKLLVLVHRIPYPPNKGDKIRSFHFLKQLAKHFDVYLGAFIDDERDLGYTEEVKAYCSGIKLIRINPTYRTLASVKGLLMGAPLSVPYYDVPDMHSWVRETISQNNIEKVFVFSSAMAQFVTPYKELSIVSDFVDIDSDKWRQYAEKKAWPLSWVYNRESEKLFNYEIFVTRQSEKVLFVSQKEAELFTTLSPETADKIDFVNNGVDSNFFTPNESFSNPYKENESVILFTGAMDYWANVDAIIWFVEQVLPLLREEQAGVVLYIVGSNPIAKVKELQSLADVIVTGRVEDMRPYLQFSKAVIAPLRIARGIQNKVLEAMAMGKPVVATSQAMEGIDAQTSGVRVEDTPHYFCKAVIEMMKLGFYRPENREFVESGFSWAENGEKLVSLIKQDFLKKNQLNN